MDLQDPNYSVYAVEILSRIFDPNSIEGIALLESESLLLDKYKSTKRSRAIIQKGSRLHAILRHKGYNLLYFYEDFQAHIFTVGEVYIKPVYVTTFSFVLKTLTTEKLN